jgi:hypothetical protein
MLKCDKKKKKGGGMIHIPPGFDFVSLVADIVSLCTPFVSIFVIIGVYTLYTRILKGRR